MVSNKPPSNEGNKRLGNQMANRQRFKPGMGKPYNPMSNMRHMSAMFNANQLGDDPGFVDFNDDSIATAPNGTGGPNAGVAASSNGMESGGNKSAPFANGNRRMNPPMKRPMKNGGGVVPGMRNRMNGGANGMPAWGPPMPPPNMFPGPPSAGGRRGPMNPPPIPPPVPPVHFRNGPGMRMRGPQNGRFGAGGPPGPMSLLSMNRPLPPPIPPMGGRPMAPPMGRMMPPPLRHGGLDGPMRRNMNGGMHGRGMGGKMIPFARNGMPTNGGTGVGPNGKRPRTKPTQPQNREEYPLDKPWVTDEIKAEHDKKADLANRLKGHRDDALFAQFKEQRDKFVKMYDTARLEYIGKHPEQDVDKILTAPASKKARIDTVEKSNAPTVSTDNAAKVEESSRSSTTTDPAFDTATASAIAASDTNDTTAITTSSANVEASPAAKSDTSPVVAPVAAPVENSAAV